MKDGYFNEECTVGKKFLNMEYSRNLNKMKKINKINNLLALIQKMAIMSG